MEPTCAWFSFFLFGLLMPIFSLVFLPFFHCCQDTPKTKSLQRGLLAGNALAGTLAAFSLRIFAMMFMAIVAFDLGGGTGKSCSVVDPQDDSDPSASAVLFIIILVFFGMAFVLFVSLLASINSKMARDQPPHR